MISKSGITSWSRGVEWDEIRCVALRKTCDEISMNQSVKIIC
jgi:hypothetical protein